MLLREMETSARVLTNSSLYTTITLGMDIEPISVYYYQTIAGRCPFKDFFESLDRQIQQIIDARLVRVRRGLFGNVENLGGGIGEIKEACRSISASLCLIPGDTRPQAS